MKTLRIAAIAVGALAGLNFASLAAPAQTRDAHTFSYNTDAVAAAYNDGYWDKDRQFHRWSSVRQL